MCIRVRILPPVCECVSIYKCQGINRLQLLLLSAQNRSLCLRELGPHFATVEGARPCPRAPALPYVAVGILIVPFVAFGATLWLFVLIVCTTGPGFIFSVTCRGGTLV